MRAFFDPDMYGYIEDIELDGWDVSEFYGTEFRNRKWDVCTTPLTELCKLVGISSVNIGTTVTELEKYRLVERVAHYFKVYLRPRIKE
ncbi:MAG: hypothetical protein AVO38_10980 [delta proteobacterium ML8_D]|nr:MAG: hypothetical protein AVO38_10980 [delta proteobacterium ML8_D]